MKTISAKVFGMLAQFLPARKEIYKYYVVAFHSSSNDCVVALNSRIEYLRVNVTEIGHEPEVGDIRNDDARLRRPPLQAAQ